MQDPHAALRDAVFRQVFEGPAQTDPRLRAAAADSVGLPQDLQPFVDKIHAHAYTITSPEVASLQAVYGDDKLFELIVSAALGASRNRLRAGLAALEGA